MGLGSSRKEVEFSHSRVSKSVVCCVWPTASPNIIAAPDPSTFGSFRKLGGGGLPYFGVLTIRILLIRVPYLGPLFSETPIL